MAQADMHLSNIIAFPHPHAIGSEPDAAIREVMWELIDISLDIEDHALDLDDPFYDALVQKIGEQVNVLGRMLSHARDVPGARDTRSADLLDALWSGYNQDGSARS